MNFGAAAGELHLTQSAVSRQIKSLEDELGAPLFLRGTRHVEITPDGQVLLRAVEPWLQKLDSSVQRIRQTRSRPRVSITTFASFASLWLLPRVEAFQRRHPDIDIRVSAQDALVDLDDSELDLALRFCSREQAGAGALHLFDETLTPVVSRGLAERIRSGGAPPLAQPADLARHTLAEEDDDRAGSEDLGWRTWLESQGEGSLQPARWLYLSYTYQQVQAALAGHGVALARLPLVYEALQRGELVEPFGPDRRIGSAVCLLDVRVAERAGAARGRRIRRLGAGRGGADPHRDRRDRGRGRALMRQNGATPRSVTISASGWSCGSAANVRGVDAADRPGDADRADLRVRRQPAVEIAAAVAEAKAGVGEADAGHQHDIGNDLRTRAAADLAFVAQRRRAAVPGAVVHRGRRAACKRQRQRQFRKPRVGGNRSGCVKFRADRPVEAETLRFELRENRAQFITERGGRGRIGQRREAVALGQQTAPQRLPGLRRRGGHGRHQGRNQALSSRVGNSVYRRGSGLLICLLALAIGWLALPASAQARMARSSMPARPFARRTRAASPPPARPPRPSAIRWRCGSTTGN